MNHYFLIVLVLYIGGWLAIMAYRKKSRNSTASDVILNITAAVVYYIFARSYSAEGQNLYMALCGLVALFCWILARILMYKKTWT